MNEPTFGLLRRRRVVLLQQVLEIGERLLGRQALRLHAAYPFLLDDLGLLLPLRALLIRELVMLDAGGLDRRQAVLLDLVPGGAGELGAPRAAQAVDHL